MGRVVIDTLLSIRFFLFVFYTTNMHAVLKVMILFVKKKYTLIMVGFTIEW